MIKNLVFKNAHKIDASAHLEFTVSQIHVRQRRLGTEHLSESFRTIPTQRVVGEI